MAPKATGVMGDCSSFTLCASEVGALPHQGLNSDWTMRTDLCALADRPCPGLPTESFGYRRPSTILSWAPLDLGVFRNV